MSEQEYQKSVTVLVRFGLEEADLVHIVNKVDMVETINLKAALDGKWVATNPDGHPSWRGEHTFKHGAVLEYLKRRLGISAEEDEA